MGGIVFDFRTGMVNKKAQVYSCNNLKNWIKRHKNRFGNDFKTILMSGGLAEKISCTGCLKRLYYNCSPYIHTELEPKK